MGLSLERELVGVGRGHFGFSCVGYKLTILYILK